MRLFTALDISAGARAALVDVIARLGPAGGFRWNTAENLHITTKFIGSWPPERFEALRQALAAMPKPGLIEIRVAGLAWFPNPHNPRVLFAQVAENAALHELHKQTDAACAAVGIPPETKDFAPHLTLARVKSREGLPEVRGRIAQLPEQAFGFYPARAFHLYESLPGPGGSEYFKREEFPLL